MNKITPTSILLMLCGCSVGESDVATAEPSGSATALDTTTGADASTGSTSTTTGATTTTGDATTESSGVGTTTTTTGGSSGGTDASTTDGGTSGDVECVAAPDDPDATWSRRFPAAYPYGVRWPSLAVDPSGAIVWGAHFKGPIDLGDGSVVERGDWNWRVFFARYDGPCALDWSRLLGDDANPILNFSIAVVGSFSGTIDFGGVTLEATFGLDGYADLLWETYDLFVARYDAEGTLLWARRFGDDASQRAYDVAVTDEGELIVVGSFRGTVDLGDAVAVGDGSSDGLLARFTGDGELVWHSTFSAPADVDIFNVDVSGGGLISIGGLAASGVDFGGGPLDAEEGTYEYYAQFEPSGKHRWSRRLSPGYEPRSLAADDSGAVYAAGETKFVKDTPREAFLARFDPDGAIVWIRESAGDIQARGYDVAISAEGEAELVGSVFGTTDFGGGPISAADSATDLFFVRFDPAGEIVSQTLVGAPAGAIVFPQAHRFGPAGERVTVGAFEGTVDLGAGPMTSEKREFFLRRVAP